MPVSFLSFSYFRTHARAKTQFKLCVFDSSLIADGWTLQHDNADMLGSSNTNKEPAFNVVRVA